MFNFYVVSAGHDIVTDAGRATTCRRKFKAPWLPTEVQKMKDLSKTWVSPNNRLNNSDQKLKTCTFGIREQNKGTTFEKQQLKEDLGTRKE